LEEQLGMKKFIVVISAPSGAGKTTVIRGIRERDPRFAYSISATTRPPRSTEVDGRDYFFISEAEFERCLSGGKFAEWAVVHGYHYGTLKEQIDKQIAGGRYVIMDVDVQGARQLRESCPNGVFIYLIPPSMAELRRRLASRGTEDEAALQTRLRNAETELRDLPAFGYLVVNDEVEETCRQVVEIVEAEGRRISRLDDPLKLVAEYLGAGQVPGRKP